MPVARRIANDFSYERRINHDTPFAWQAQYLVRLQGDACVSALCNCIWWSSCVTFRVHCISYKELLFHKKYLAVAVWVADSCYQPLNALTP